MKTRNIATGYGGTDPSSPHVNRPSLCPSCCLPSTSAYAASLLGWSWLLR